MATSAYKKPSSSAVCVIISKRKHSFQTAPRRGAGGADAIIRFGNSVLGGGGDLHYFAHAVKAGVIAALPIMAQVSVLTVMMPPSIR